MGRWHAFVYTLADSIAGTLGVVCGRASFPLPPCRGPPHKHHTTHHMCAQITAHTHTQHSNLPLTYTPGSHTLHIKIEAVSSAHATPLSYISACLHIYVSYM